MVVEAKMDNESIYKKTQELESAGDYGEAAALFKKLVTLAVDARYHIAYGHCLQRLKHWKESAAQLAIGIELKPHYAEGDARLMLAQALFELGKKAKAIEQWRIVAGMSPDYPSYDAVPNEAKAMLIKHAGNS
jgi:tetratricopeptide (TPR) repeat protein